MNRILSARVSMRAANVWLLAGVSALALSFASGANAQVVLDNANTPGAISNNGAGEIQDSGSNAATGITVGTGGNQITINGNNGNIGAGGTISGGNLVSNNALNVTGASTLSGGALINGGANVASGNLQVTSGNLGVGGTGTFGNTLTVSSGGANITGNTGLLGQTNFGTSNTTHIDATGTLSVNGGGTTINGATGTLSVGTGATTIDGTTGSLTTTATTNLKAVTNFGTTGQSSFDTGGNLQIGPAPTGISLNTNGTGNFNGLLTANNGLAVTGGTNTDTLTVSGASNLHGNATIGTTSANTLTVNSTSTFNALSTFTNGVAVSGGGLTVAGGTTTGSLAVTNNASVGGNLAVTGNTTVGNFAVAPHSTVDMGGNVVNNVGTPLVGTDAANKAYVDAQAAWLNKKINDQRDGVAIALSIQNPDLVGNEHFGVSANFGTYNGSDAFGVAAEGVVGHNIFGTGDRVAITGGVGFSTNGSNVAGRVGAQLTW